MTLAACGPQRPAEASGGTALFESLDCIDCHKMDGRGTGPSLAGLYGETIPLENGGSVTADDQYIRTAILDPGRHIHAGYQPVMPSYRGRISEEELSTLVEYIRSLNGGK